MPRIWRLIGHAWLGASSSRGLNIRRLVGGFSMAGVRHYMGFSGVIYGYMLVTDLSIEVFKKNGKSSKGDLSRWPADGFRMDEI